MSKAPRPTDQPKPRIRAGYNAHVYQVESATRPGLFHMTNTATGSCTCEAGRHHVPCWHLFVARQLDAWRHQFAPQGSTLGLHLVRAA